MHRIMTNELSYAYSHEVKCRVLTRPDPDVIAKLQGYK